jgi:hypothetical protein
MPSRTHARRRIQSGSASVAKTCWQVISCSNLVMIDPYIAVEQRCNLRYTTLSLAQAACQSTKGCGGVVQDTGLQCPGDTTHTNVLKRYELRSPAQQARLAGDPSACNSNSWIMRTGATCLHMTGRGRGAPDRWAPPAYGTRRGVGSHLVPRLNMREYFQGHWNPGTDVGADCARMRRVGPSGDGGKMVCFDAVPKAGEECFVLSVGVGGPPGQPPDFRFEIDLHRRLPHCKIDVYDGTNFGRGAIRNAPHFVNFHAENFSPTTWKRYAGRRIDMFKIDCEGCEFADVPPFLAHVPTEQLMVEVHGNKSPHQVHKLMSELNATHGIFYREPNIQHSDGTCIEFALRRRSRTAARAQRRLMEAGGVPSLVPSPAAGASPSSSSSTTSTMTPSTVSVLTRTNVTNQ